MNIERWLEDALKKIKSTDPNELMSQLESYGLVKPKSAWIKCSDRMPERGIDVLACRMSTLGGYEEIETAQWHGGMKAEQSVFITSADTINPTHWQPLPSPPEDMN